MARHGLKVVLPALLLLQSAMALGLDWRQEQAVMDSLARVHPRQRYSWLRDRSLEGMFGPTGEAPDADGLVCAGRWSYGPAYDVDCRVSAGDTLIALGRGSGVSLVRFSRTAPQELELLADVNAERILNQVMLRDTLLLVGTNAGLEVYNVSDERRPSRLSWIKTGCAGFDLKDSLAYITWYDTFKLYSIADPANPYRVGWCRDSGGSVTVAGNTAFLADRSGLHAVDVSNPAAPHRVGSWGTYIISAQARGNICCVTQDTPEDRFTVLDVSNPAAMVPLSYLSGVGGWDVHLGGQFAFLSGFHVVDLADTAHVRLVGSMGLSGYKYGVWGESGFDKALVANELDGLVLVDIQNPSNPVFDTAALGAGSALDLEIHGSLCYVADEGGGLKVVDVANPTAPNLLGQLDTLGVTEGCYTAVVDDSFAYMGWFNTPFFRVADISDPTRPAPVGFCNPFEYAQDMVLRDTLVYCAEDYRFQVVNVARPRSPTVVGTCNLPERSRNLCVRDTFAYVAQGYTGLIILSVAQPAAPRELGRYVSERSTHGVWVEDTLAFIAEFDSGLTIVSVARPQSCYKVGSHTTAGWAYDVLVQDGIAYLSCADGIRAFDVRNPRAPQEAGFQPTPYYGWRLVYGAPYLYVACADAGVGIYETCSVGVAEPEPPASRASLLLRPSPVRGRLLVELDRGVRMSTVRVSDVAGRTVLLSKGGQQGNTAEFDVGELSAGLYFVEVVAHGGSSVKGKFVTQ